MLTVPFWSQFRKYQKKSGTSARPPDHKRKKQRTPKIRNYRVVQTMSEDVQHIDGQDEDTLSIVDVGLADIDSLIFEFFDHDTGSADDPMGQIQITNVQDTLIKPLLASLKSGQHPACEAWHFLTPTELQLKKQKDIVRDLTPFAIVSILYMPSLKLVACGPGKSKSWRSSNCV